VEYSAKRVIFAILIPAALITGLVVGVLLFRAETLSQMNALKERLLFQPGAEQSDILESAASTRFDVLENYTERLAQARPDEAARILSEINASAKDVGFSYIALIGRDGRLLTDKNETVDISGLEFWKAVVGGHPQICIIGLSDRLRFAFAVPFTKDGENNGAVIGFFSREESSTVITPDGDDGSPASAVFDSSGSIIVETGDVRSFKGASNIYDFFNMLASENAIATKDADAVEAAVRAGQRGSIAPAGDMGLYYAYQPLGSGGWYIVNSVSKEYLETEIAASRILDPFWTSVLVLIAVLLIVSIVIPARKRLIELREGYRKYTEACTIDSLTGLLNKPGFETEVGRALVELPAERVCALISFEVVSFRTYNELYGYEAGDTLLKTIAEIAKKAKNDGDVTARLYSDHFAWFIIGADSEEILSTLREAVKAAKMTELPFFLCAGLYFIGDRSMPVHDMLDKASVAKDTIKLNYSTGIAVYDESMLECRLQDAQMVGGMMKGLQDGEFVEYYQPKYNVLTETVTGAEALVRWKKPDGELIAPNRFIELFERNGFIRKMDFYIFERVCAFLASSMEAGKKVLPVSVNFSRVHMHDLHFPQRLSNLAQKYGVEPKNLEIELTESAFIMDTNNQNKIIDKLHEYGFTIAIDDFGSGFSSLNMLKDFDVDTLKIDTKFLEGFERGGKVGTVVTSVIRMAKWIGIPVVAEGVETREQVDFLRSLGCEMIQGFYYSRPIPRDEYEKLLDTNVSARFVGEKPDTLTLGGINAALGGDSLVNSLLDGILGGFGIYELSGDRLEAIRVNRAYYEMMGYPDAAAFREHSLNVLTQAYPPDVKALLETCRRAVKTGEVQNQTSRRYKFNGTLIQCDLLIKHIGGTERSPFICITFIDTTKRLLIDRESELDKFCNALYAIFDDIFEFNYMENTFRRLSRNHVKQSEGTTSLSEAEVNWLENIIYPEDRARIRHYIALARNEKLEFPFNADYRVIKNGEIRWVTATMVSIAAGCYLLCQLDVTQKKQFELLMETLKGMYGASDFDFVSGVLSGTAVKDLIRKKMQTEGRDGLSALIVVGLDDYRRVSDEFGTHAGNALIKEVSLRIKTLFGEKDIIGRIADDKLVVYIDGIGDVPAARAKARKIREYLSDIVLPGNINAEYSLGLSMIYPGKTDFEEALSKAEAALMTAGSGGTDCAAFDEKPDKDSE